MKCTHVNFPRAYFVTWKKWIFDNVFERCSFYSNHLKQFRDTLLLNPFTSISHSFLNLCKSFKPVKWIRSENLKLCHRPHSGFFSITLPPNGTNSLSIAKCSKLQQLNQGCESLYLIPVLFLKPTVTWEIENIYIYIYIWQMNLCCFKCVKNIRITKMVPHLKLNFHYRS